MHDKNVFILGAGFGAEGGAPLLRDFLQTAQRLLVNPTSRLSKDERDLFTRVFNHRYELAAAREAIEVDLDNIEHLFGLLDLEATIDSRKRQFRDDLVYVILRTLELSIDWVRVDDERRSPVRLFARHLRPIDAVLTFNYDLQLDQQVSRCGQSLDYCLADDDGGKRAPGPNSIKALKLHGSANWFQCTNCSKTTVVDHTSSPMDAFVSDRVRRSCEHCHHAGVLRPTIVPPGWRKPGIDKDDILVPVWRTAVEELREAQRLVIIGYSMPESDIFFRYLLALGVNMRSIDRVVLIDPDHAVDARYQRLFDEVFRSHRFHYSDTRCRDSFAGIAQNWLNRSAAS